MPRPPGKDNIADQVAVLSKREQQVAALVCKGLSNKLVAQTLNISESTIDCHLTSIYTKLGIRSRYELLVLFDRVRSS